MKIYRIIFLTFIFHFSNAQNLIWAKSMGSIGYDAGSSITTDANSNVYTTGTFSGTVDFDPGPGTFNLTASGNNDVFVSKTDASGALIWAVKMGGANSDQGSSIAVDAAGNVYTTGFFVGTADFDPGLGVFNLSSIGSYDIFVSKINISGNFIWAKSFGSPNYDWVNSIAIDGVGNVIIVGTFSGTADFDPGPATFNMTSGPNDVFISKLDGNGAFMWSKQFGGTGYNNGRAVALDATGNIYTTGSFDGTTDFDPGSGVYNLTPVGNEDIFISKLNASGSFLWAKKISGSGNENATSIAVDALGNVFTTGSFNGTVDFDPGASVYYLTTSGVADIFINKLDATGNFISAKSMGGANDDYSQSIAIDGSGNLYITGWFNGTSDFDPGIAVNNFTSVGSDDIFIIKLDASGIFVWAKSMGGTSDDEAFSTATDGAGNVYATGYFKSTANFNTAATPYNFTSAGLQDIFVVKLNDAATGFFGEKNCINDNLNIYPNPNSGLFKITGDNDLETPIRIIIRDVMGRNIKLIERPSLHVYEFNLENERPGVYTISIYYANAIITKRAMIN